MVSTWHLCGPFSRLRDLALLLWLFTRSPWTRRRFTFSSQPENALAGNHRSPLGSIAALIRNGDAAEGCRTTSCISLVLRQPPCKKILGLPPRLQANGNPPASNSTTMPRVPGQPRQKPETTVRQRAWSQIVSAIAMQPQAPGQRSKVKPGQAATDTSPSGEAPLVVTDGTVGPDPIACSPDRPAPTHVLSCETRSDTAISLGLGSVRGSRCSVPARGATGGSAAASCLKIKIADPQHYLLRRSDDLPTIGGTIARRRIGVAQAFLEGTGLTWTG